MPSSLAAVAKAAWVQCVKGRPLALGGSQAKAMIAQICSGSSVGGPRTRRIAQPFGERPPLAGKPAFAPALHGGAPDVQLPSRLVHTDTRIGQKDNARTHYQALRRVVLSHDGFKTVAVFRRQIDGDSSAAGHGEQVEAEES